MGETEPAFGVSDAAGRCAPGGLAARLHLSVAAFLRDERGATAVEYGMINYAVPAEEVMPKALELAEEILANAPLALKWSKYLVHAATQMPEEDAMRYFDAAYRFLEKTEDGIEGPAAFVEKRAPKWVGR